MPEEIPFRVALLVIFVLTVSIAAYHRLQAAASGEKLSRKEEGYVFAIVLRLFGLALWLSTFAYLVYPDSTHWASLPLPHWLRWCGFVTGLLGAPLLYWTVSTLGKNLTDTVVTRAEATLVTHGPYRWVRHPFYVVTALVMASVMLLSANWLIGLLSLIVLFLLVIRTPKEEAMLLQRFGQEYRDYAATTGRFFPRFRR